MNSMLEELRCLDSPIIYKSLFKFFHNIFFFITYNPFINPSSTLTQKPQFKLNQNLNHLPFQNHNHKIIQIKTITQQLHKISLNPLTKSMQSNSFTKIIFKNTPL